MARSKVCWQIVETKRADKEDWATLMERSKAHWQTDETRGLKKAHCSS